MNPERQSLLQKNGNHIKQEVKLVTILHFSLAFTFSGLGSLLAVYYNKHLMFSEGTSTFLTNTTIAAKYLFALLSGVLVDTTLGKFIVICTGSLLFLIGNLLLLGPELLATFWVKKGEYDWIQFVFIGFYLGSIGNGLATPSISNFIGDQFNPDQENAKVKYFSWFHWLIQISAIVSCLMVPFLMKYFPLYVTFAALSGTILLGFLTFLIPCKHYRKVNPSKSIYPTFFSVIYHAISNRRRYIYSQKVGLVSHSTWLDPALTYFPPQIVQDVKVTLNAMQDFVPLPFFWAIFFQSTSLWVFQASQTNLSIGGFEIPSNAVTALNPLLNLLLLPFFSHLVYPFFKRRKHPLKSVSKMTVGLIASALSMVCAGLLQLRINTASTSPSLLLILPQYFLLSCGEVNVILLSVQSPPSLQSILMEVWIFTLFIGSLLLSFVGLADLGRSPILYFSFAGVIIMVMLFFLFIVKKVRVRANIPPPTTTQQQRIN